MSAPEKVPVNELGRHTGRYVPIQLFREVPIGGRIISIDKEKRKMQWEVVTGEFKGRKFNSGFSDDGFLIALFDTLEELENYLIP